KTVRFAYTLIQPWSLGLVCKCDAIFRPVSRVYNTFGRGRRILRRWTRNQQMCVCVCVCVCVRASYVCMLDADTCTCVRRGIQQTHSIPSLLSEFTAISFQDNLRVDGAA
ncbi:hypothetical protein WN55_08416, partial [Dufourea novaeangliae]